MYEENREQGFDGNMSPDDHRPEPPIVNSEVKSQPQSQQPQGNSWNSQPQGSSGGGQPQGSGWSSQPQGSSGGGQPQGNSWNSQHQGGSGSGQPQGSGWSSQYQSGGYEGQPGVSGGQSPIQGKGRKRGIMARRVAGITAAALLFGVVSGGTMVGVNIVADSMKEETYPQVSQSEVIAATEPSQAAPSGAGSSSINNAVALDVSAIVKNAMPSIVAVNNTVLYEGNFFFGGAYEVPGSGSGIIVGQNDEELLVVTNNHVVEGSNSLSVVFIDSTSVNAAIKGTDADSDLAVIAIPLKDIPASTLSQIKVATLGDSDALEVGQGVIAIGNALGYGQSVTVGWVSALEREVVTEGSATRTLLQTDAAINPGNSGGALLNMKGEVIGINAAKYSSTDVEGIGYAIPISKAEDIINSLMTKRTRNNMVEEGKEGYLGIQGLTVEDTMARQLGMPSGIFVSGILEGGAASKTDLREKDIITKFDDQTVRSMAALQELLKYYKEGETVTMTVQSLKDGVYEERTIEITLGGRATLGETAPQKKQ